MSGDTFTTFFGEFLVNPVPVEWSGNYCSHACPFCFANLNSQYRKQKDGVSLRYADAKASMNLLRDLHKRQSLEAFWMRSGYPVVMSNKVDPFANSNYRIALPMIETLTELEIPIAFQTRGGRGIDEALDIVKPSCWYISIDHSDDSTRREFAPANPSIESRYELIQQLTDRGHTVVVGLNPLTIEWVPKPEVILERSYQAGASGVWIEVMHFNREQANLAKTNGVMPSAMIDRYRKRDSDRELFTHWIRARQDAIAIGLEINSMGQCIRSDFYDAFKKVYPTLLPVMQDWVNFVIDQNWDSDRFIRFDEFYQFFEPHLPKGKLRLGHYIGANAHQIPREMGKDWSNWMSWEKLFQMIWSDRRIKFNPTWMPAFAYVDDGRGGVERCDRGLPLMAFWQDYTEFLFDKE